MVLKFKKSFINLLIFIFLFISLINIYNSSSILFEIKNNNELTENGLTLSLVFSTFLGGNGEDGAGPVLLDSNNNIIIVAKTPSTDFPTVNAFQDTNNGSDDVIITKFNEDGQEIIYSTYFGGSGNEYVYGASLDSQGNIVIVGITESNNFPVKNPLWDNRSGSDRDIFIAKFSGDGQSLIYSTYLFSSIYYMVDVAVDSQDNIIILGTTDAIRFNSTQEAYQTEINGSTDLFLTKLSADGQTILSSTLLGGSGDDQARGLTLDHNDNPVFTGYVSSTNFPLKNQIKSNKGTSDLGVVVGKYNFTSNNLLFSSYFGGINQWGLLQVTVDNNNDIILTGRTNFENFPLVNAYYNESKSNADAFIAKIDSDNYEIIFSTLYAGLDTDGTTDVVIDENNNIVVVGSSGSSDLPVKNEYQTNQAFWDGFILMMSADGQELIFASYLGGYGDDYIYGIYLDTDLNSIILFGHANSFDFPLLNAYQEEYKGGFFDMFICKFDIITLSDTSIPSTSTYLTSSTQSTADQSNTTTTTLNQTTTEKSDTINGINTLILIFGLLGLIVLRKMKH
ncbi:MAG: hypothetical protein ACXAC7_14615 [Candidatus Hodarchaeales archaeon]